MGNFYVNYSLHGVTQPTVATALARRSALVSPAVNNVVVVFDEQSDSQDTSIINALAADLSIKCKCPVLATMNHDDDVLWCHLFSAGKSVDEYNSCPGYFDDSIESDDPAGGDASKFAAAFGVGDPAPIEKVFRARGDEYAFAIERHTDLAEALRLPSFAVGGGSTDISNGEVPNGLSEGALVRTA